MTLAVFADQFRGFLIGQVFDALLGLKMKLHPEPLIGGVDEAEGMAAEAMHMPIGFGDAAVTHQDGHLV